MGALAGEAQLGGWTPGPHPLNHEGTEGPGLKGEERATGPEPVHWP